MEINTRTLDGVTIVEISGDIDGSTAPAAQEAIQAVAVPDCRMILDMSQVAYMSSAGLRMLLVTYRTISGQGGQVVLVGLSEDLEDTMEMTGFLGFFKHHKDLEGGLESLASA